MPEPVPEQPAPVEPRIKKVAVIGAGPMGRGIAGHLANAGIEVVLLDKFPGAAQKAVDIMVKAKPDKDPMNAGLMSPKNAKLITTGTTDDDMGLIADADLIIEAVWEDLDTKRELFCDVENHRKPGSIVTSNTSTIPLSLLVEGRSEDFKKHFAITHFFNPVRFMKLLEVVRGADTDAAVMDALKEIGDVHLGKSVVESHDVPGFIGNRIGTFYLQRAINEAMDSGLKIEETDAIMGAPMGFPKDGIFGLIDIVGLDVAPKVLESLHKTLPESDAFQPLYREHPLMKQMIADGNIGRKGKSKSGFYRLKDGKKQAIDLATGEYRPAEKIKLPRRDMREIFEGDAPVDRLAWAVMRDTLHYALSVTPEIADDILSVDEAMRTGYNWKRGPFEIVDKLGPDWLAKKFEADGLSVPPLLAAAKGGTFYRIDATRKEALGLDGHYHSIPRKDGVLDLKDIKRTSKPILKNASASLWDLGDGAVCVELHSQLNAMDPNIFGLLNETMDLMMAEPEKYKALVVYNDGPHFSYGANLLLAAETINHADWEALDDMLFQGQETYRRLRYLPKPVVSVVGGMALGGGCEVTLHCDAVQAQAETYMGLVEAGVGFIPAWGGCTRLLERHWNAPGRPKGPMPPVKRAFETIATGTYSSSGQDAMEKLFLRPGIDGVSMNRDRLLADGKARALSLVPGYTPPEPFVAHLPGPSGKSALSMAVDGFLASGMATFHDVAVADALATVLTGGDTNVTEVIHENDLYRLEREQFLSLVKMPETRARLLHMLTARKPLREPPLAVPKSTHELRAGRPNPFHGPKREMPYPPRYGVGKPAQEAAPDYAAMKPADAMIHLLSTDDWAPDPDLPEGLKSVFIKAAEGTREHTLQVIRDNKGMAGTVPRPQQIALAAKFIGQQMDKTRGMVAAAGDDQRAVAELSGRLAMYSHMKERLAVLANG